MTHTCSAIYVDCDGLQSMVLFKTIDEAQKFCDFKNKLGCLGWEAYDNQEIYDTAEEAINNQE